MSGFTVFINALICPTDSTPTLIPVSNGNYATHNYPMNTGSGYSVVQNPAPPLADIPNGVLSRTRPSRPAAIIDGMSNTVAVAETVRSTLGSTYANNPLDVFLDHGQQQHDRAADHLRRRLCVDVPEPPAVDDPVPGYARGALALRRAGA